jgi:flagellin-like hook-associated protein FlgL
MKVSGLGVSTVLMRQIANTKNDMAELQRQISSGKVADTYGGLGNDRTLALSLQQEMSSIEAFQNNITLASTRIEIMNTAVETMRTHATDVRSDLLVGSFEIVDDGQTLAQAQAETRLADTIDLLNTEISGRYMFSGTATDTSPVATPSEILDGSGSKAGFRQIMDERMQADLGSDGLGRLDLSVSSSTVTIAEDAADSPFGYKLSDVSSGLSGTTITGPTGSPTSLDVQFSSTLPEEGESIVITFDMPDGTTSEITLTAGTETNLEEGTFAIGADADSTAANFNTLLTGLIEEDAATNLKAASQQAAANDFFVSGTATAQRVDGPPYDTATALVDATEDDTVQWYRGEQSDTDARETTLVRVDDGQLVAYGSRADEEAYTTLLKQLAVMSSATYDETSDTANAEYAAMTERVSAELAYTTGGGQSLDRISGELAIASITLDQASERHTTTDNLITNYLSEIESVETEQAAAKLLSLQTQLEASYSITSMLSEMSLVNYL